MLDSDVNLDVKMGTVCINYEMAAPGEFVEQFPFNTVHMSWKCFGFSLTFKFCGFGFEEVCLALGLVPVLTCLPYFMRVIIS